MEPSALGLIPKTLTTQEGQNSQAAYLRSKVMAGAQLAERGKEVIDGYNKNKSVECTRLENWLKSTFELAGMNFNLV